MLKRHFSNIKINVFLMSRKGDSTHITFAFFKIFFKYFVNIFKDRFKHAVSLIGVMCVYVQKVGPREHIVSLVSRTHTYRKTEPLTVFDPTRSVNRIGRNQIRPVDAAGGRTEPRVAPGDTKSVIARALDSRLLRQR